MPLRASPFALVFIAGCTLLTSTSDARRPIPPPAATIHIEPSSPRTLDDLTVILDAPSTLPGVEVEHDVEWFVDGALHGTNERVRHTATHKAEVWRVVVTPRVGTRSGPASEATVTIANSAPEISSVGFNHYRPIASDTLRAYPDERDADGDILTRTVRWVRNGPAVIAGESTTSLELSAHGLAAGSSVRAEVTVSDGEATSALYVTPFVPVANEVLGWRPLRPRRAINRDRRITGQPGMVYDADDRRFVYVIEDVVWELPRDRPRDAVRVVPSGTSPGYDTSRGGFLVEHPSGNEIIFVNMFGDVHRLELDRGEERWSRVTSEAPDPGNLFSMLWQPSVFVDTARNRIVLFGGEAEGTFACSLEQGSSWVRIAAPAAGPTLIGSAWLHEPGTDVAYLVGGAGPGVTEDDDEWAGGTSATFRFDLVNATFTRLTDADSPTPIVWPAVAVDKDGRQAYLVEGAQSINGSSGDPFRAGVRTPHDGVLVFDFQTERFRTLASPGIPGLHARMRGTASWDAESQRVLHTSGFVDALDHPDPAAREQAWRTDIVEIAPDGTREASALMGRDIPHGVCDPGYSTGALGTHLVIVGGRRGQTPVAGTFTYSFADDELTAAHVAPDPMHGSPPAASGMGRWSGEGSFFFGGLGVDGQPLADLWELHLNSGFRWEKLTNEPWLARWNASLHGTAFLLVLGGVNPATLTDAWQRPCTLEDHVCSWEQVWTQATQPGAGAMLARRQAFDIAIGPGASAMSVWTSSSSSPSSASTWVLESIALGPGTTFAPPNRTRFTVSQVTAGAVTRLILHGGDLGLVDPTAWELRYEGTWTWNRLVPAADPTQTYLPSSVRAGHAAGYDEDRNRLVVFGGGTTCTNDLWELRLGM